MGFIKRQVGRIINYILFNTRRPLYWEYFYDLSKHYVTFYRGDGNADPHTNGEYRFLTLLAKRPHLRVLFDVGANGGTYSTFVLQLRPDVNIHCFEPDPRAFAQLSEKLAGHVILNQIALGDIIADNDLHLSELSSELSSFYHHPQVSSSQAVSVRVTTLDAYCQGHSVFNIDLLKIDTEGYELAVLLGSDRMLREHRIDAIQFEYGGASAAGGVMFKDIFELLESYGFDIFKLMPLTVKKVVYSPELEGCPYANFIALRRGGYDLPEYTKNRDHR